MKLNLRDSICAKDCNGEQVSGTVVKFLVNTIVIENQTHYFLISKKWLGQHGYDLTTMKSPKNSYKKNNFLISIHTAGK